MKCINLPFKISYHMMSKVRHSVRAMSVVLSDHKLLLNLTSVKCH